MEPDPWYSSWTMTTMTMTKNKIKRNDFVTLNVDIPSAYGNTVTKAGTKCRVWKAKRDGTVNLSPEGGYHSLTVNVALVTRIDGPKASVKVGDIFVCSWGYEQTNIDYYQVVKLLPKSVVIQSISSTRTYEGPMHGKMVPIVNSFVGEERTVRIRVDGDGKPSFRVNSFSWAYPWKGEANFFSEWH